MYLMYLQVSSLVVQIIFLFYQCLTFPSWVFWVVLLHLMFFFGVDSGSSLFFLESTSSVDVVKVPSKGVGLVFLMSYFCC